MNLKKLIFILIAGIAFTACSDEEKDAQGNSEKGESTYLNLSIALPTKSTSKTLPEDYNPAGTYEGLDWVKNLDVYIVEPGGEIEAIRFLRSELSASGHIISPIQPFKTTAGSKNIYVVLNNPGELNTNSTKKDKLIGIEGLAQIENIESENYDVITMTGYNESVSLQPDISQQDVISNSINLVEIDVTRIASRVIVTSEDTPDVAFSSLGDITEITYSVAQGTKQVYWLQQDTYTTYGSSYIPNTLDEYTSLANSYYDYTDLSSPTAVPNKPAGEDFKSLPGKFLFENTHAEGDFETTEYRKGNTAYVLVKATFVPKPEAIVDAGTLIDGTFYVGQSDGNIYSSMQNAKDAVTNQKVATYKNGKMIYYAWLNPDDINKPLNSPVVRNNIYHINITGFKNLGFTWNPLFPENPENPGQNPDPKPGPEEPVIPIDPTDPLSVEETYMTVRVRVLDWAVHSYDINL